jgi:acetyl-CoA synthetase
MPVLPAEIENLLMSQEEVSEVAVIGKPDRTKGSLIKIFIVWNKGKTPISDESIKELIKTNISNYAVPSEIVVMDALPKTIIGKTNILELEKM